MSKLEETSLEIIANLGTIPSLPFQEQHIAKYITNLLSEWKISFEIDFFGNIIATLPGESGKNGIGFISHMDHPGFEIIKKENSRLIAKALGGVPEWTFTKKTPVKIIGQRMELIEGYLDGRYGDENDRMVYVKTDNDEMINIPSGVMLSVDDFNITNNTIRMLAADDLAGCSAILAALESAQKINRSHTIYGIFTRAEEVGLIGARAIARNKSIPQDTFIVSVESSRELPGANVGNGPVIRTGDALFTFNYEAEQILTIAKEHLESNFKTFQAQRQLMSGGVCEASAFLVNGYRATGIAIPLKNYHNAGENEITLAEEVNKFDFLNAANLILESSQSISKRHESKAWKRLSQVPENELNRLEKSSDVISQ
jgi:endoglucanase